MNNGECDHLYAAFSFHVQCNERGEVDDDDDGDVYSRQSFIRSLRGEWGLGGVLNPFVEQDRNMNQQQRVLSTAISSGNAHPR